MISDKLFLLIAPTRPFPSSANLRQATGRLAALVTSGRRPGKQDLIHVFRYFFQIVFAIVFLPVSIPLYLAGFRVVYGNVLSQIGEIVLLDAEIKRRAILGRREKLVLVLGSCRRGNRHLASRYREHIMVVDWPSPAALFWCLVSYNPLMQVDIVKYDAASDNSLLAKVNRIWNRQARQPLLAPEPFDHAWDNIPVSIRDKVRDGRLVCIHSRDQGFYEDWRRTTRNYDIASLVPVIDLLTAVGVAVVRIGSKPRHRIDEKHLAHPELYFDSCDIATPAQDVYFLSNGLFFIGCSSGPAEVPMLFGKNAMLINTYTNVTGLRFWPGDISIFKKLRSIESGACLPLHQYTEPPFDLALQKDRLQALGYELVDNTEDEILIAFADFLRGIDAQLKPADLSCETIFAASNKTPPAPPARPVRPPQLRRHHWTFRALGRFSPSFLAEYVRTQQGDGVVAEDDRRSNNVRVNPKLKAAGKDKPVPARHEQ